MKNETVFKMSDRYFNRKMQLEFTDRVCLIRSGESNLEKEIIKAIRQYCRKNGIDCRYVNATMINMHKEELDKYSRVDRTKLVKDMCTGGKVIILENGDLYVRGPEIDTISDSDNIVIVTMQHTGMVDCKVQSCEYIVKSDAEACEVNVCRWA